MRIVTRLLAISRAVQLRRQFREIEKALSALAPKDRRHLAALAMREFSLAAKSEYPHLHGSEQLDKYQPWGTGTQLGIERVRSDNVQVHLRGMALWLIVVFHETKDSPHEQQQQLHRSVLRILRAVKESLPASELHRLMTEGARNAA